MMQVFTPSQRFKRQAGCVAFRDALRKVPFDCTCGSSTEQASLCTKTPKKQRSSDCVADEVTVWIKACNRKKKTEEEKTLQSLGARFWSGFGPSRNSDYAKIAFETIDFMEKRNMKKLYHFISNSIMCLCMLPLAGTAGCNMAEYTEW